MNKRHLFVIILAAVVCVAIAGACAFFFARCQRCASRNILEKTWRGYRQHFIAPDGRVMRPKDGGDTVSEGQAYAMLRAVWMNDKDAFDRCYRWSEQNLSRTRIGRDNLLAWHWAQGAVTDWMPASDADSDYALSLIFASMRWGGGHPEGCEPYARKARAVLSDILRYQTYHTTSGRLYLSPWLAEHEAQAARFPVNPSYYSPAHFRIFYSFTGDARWLGLVDTTYYLLGRLAQEFDGMKGAGLIPDWCSVDMNDALYPLEGKSPDFGWEAVRVYLRVGLDYLWFGAPEAQRFARQGILSFIEREWGARRKVFSEYRYDGTPTENQYENPLFYTAYYSMLIVGGSPRAAAVLDKVRSSVALSNGSWVYEDAAEYYVNSLAWMSELFLVQKMPFALTMPEEHDG